jgi:DNA-binding transcriptional LysR family regulator
MWSWPFAKDGCELKVRAEGPLAFNAISLILSTAMSGLGLAYLPDDVVREHVVGDAFASPWSPVMIGYHFYYPNRQPTSAFAMSASNARDLTSGRDGRLIRV